MRRRALLAAVAGALVAAFAAAPAAACLVCYGNADGGSPMVTGARFGVFLLLAVTASVLGGLVRFFFYLRSRARQAEIDGLAAEWTELQRSSTP